jgi:hypothetical protein
VRQDDEVKKGKTFKEVEDGRTDTTETEALAKVVDDSVRTDLVCA